MKKRILLTLTIALIPFIYINAQKPIVLVEDSLKVGANVYPAVSVLIPEVVYETTQKDWIKLQESGTKSKVVDESGKMSIFGAFAKNISENPINILSGLVDRDTLLILTAAFEIRNDVYIERATGEAELAKTKTWLFDFAKKEYSNLVNEQLKAEENKLKDLEKELSSLEKDQSGMERDIRTSNRKVSQEKERLTVLNNELTTLSAAISEHNTQLSLLEAGTERDAKEEYLKQLEKDRKKALRAIKKSEKKIRNAEGSITKANRAIPRNDDTQERIRRMITDQEAVVQQFTDKLNRVKAYK